MGERPENWTGRMVRTLEATEGAQFYPVCEGGFRGEDDVI